MKQVISEACWRFGLTVSRIRRERQHAFWMVNYHRVCPDDGGAIHYPSFFDLHTTPERFEEQIQFFNQYFHVCTLEEALRHSEYDRPLLVISFDDGYRDNYQYAFPILKKYNLPAIIYIVTETLSPKRLTWDNQIFYSLQKAGIVACKNFFEEALNAKISLKPNEFAKNVFNLICEKVPSHEKRLELVSQLAEQTRSIGPESVYHEYYLTPSQVQEMSQHNIQFGSHTHRHAFLSASLPEEISFELQESKKVLENVLQKPVDHFCYPSGMKDEHVLSEVKNAGYHSAATVEEGKNEVSNALFELHRYGVSNQNVHYLAFELSGLKKSLKEVF